MLSVCPILGSAGEQYLQPECSTLTVRTREMTLKDIVRLIAVSDRHYDCT